MPFGSTASRGRPMTSAEKFRAFKQRARMIDLPPVDDMARRKRLERPGNEPKWLLHYLPAAYPFPFSKGHLTLIGNVIDSVATGEISATAQPRGEGKTTVLRGLTVCLLATYRIRFPVLVGWKHSDATAAFELWLRMLCQSPEFAADYPEIATPFTFSTHATALKSLTWAHNEERIGASVNTMLKMIVLPDSRGAVAARSAQGDAKGLNATLKDGTVLRPDFLLIDDAQDTDAADKPARVAATVDTLENVFMGMAGPQNRLSVAAAVTVEAEDDVSCHWLKRAGQNATRISRISKWPDGSEGGTWEPAKDCPAKVLWDEWRDIYTDPDQGQRAANAFFRKNRKTMTGKMDVSWKYRYDAKKDVCAIDAAMRDWYHLGPDVFARGQQNRPLKRDVTLYNLRPEVIMARTSRDREPGVVPEWARMVIAATDDNPSYGLSTVIAAVGADQRMAVLWYGVHKMAVPDDMPDAAKKAAIMAEMQTHGRSLAALVCRVEDWTIDGGGAPQDTVITFAANAMQSCGIPCLCTFGRAWRFVRAKPQDRKFEQAFIRSESRSRRWAIVNSDYWREVAQKGWLGAVGAPGTCELPKGNHRDFAEQICREQLRGKAETGGTWVYVWDTIPGKHDYGDCMMMLYALAAMKGIGTGGQAEVRPTRKKYTQQQLSRGM